MSPDALQEAFNHKRKTRNMMEIKALVISCEPAPTFIERENRWQRRVSHNQVLKYYTAHVCITLVLSITVVGRTWFKPERDLFMTGPAHAASTAFTRHRREKKLTVCIGEPIIHHQELLYHHLSKTNTKLFSQIHTNKNKNKLFIDIWEILTGKSIWKFCLHSPKIFFSLLHYLQWAAWKHNWLKKVLITQCNNKWGAS